MATKEDVRRRPDVAERDLDDVIGLAARLQDEESAKRGIPASEVDKVAAELDIDPKFVDAAVARLGADRRAAELDALATKQRFARRARAVGIGGAAALLVAAGVVSGVVGSAASRMDVAGLAFEQAQASLDTALDREAALAPSLVAMAGGDPGALAATADRVRNAPTEADKIAAADELGTALAQALARLPPAEPGPAAEQRLNLQYEVVGASNRVSTEKRRYEAARLDYLDASDSTPARIAAWLGWAPPIRGSGNDVLP